MTFQQLQLFSLPDPITCPRCGHTFTPQRGDAPALSPVAEALLARIPTVYRPGQRLSIERIAYLTGYSVSRAHSGLVELALTRRGVRGHLKSLK